ncbi:glycosyltransferase [Candidatus Woesearchaeota archaeon]|mgnify:CR=1 FL=1|nr:glycosyltransferase [Candidatus Woesearchaeota archaeon]
MGDYVGYTRWKKLKKLYHLSRGIIHIHGLRYYFYVIKLEIKKNGLGLFSPDQKPISTFDNISYNEQYQNYLKNLNEKLEKESFDKSIKLSYRPKILIVLIINDQNLENIKNTINSIKNQRYDNWQIAIFSTNYSQNIPRINELIEKDSPKILFYDKLSDTSFKTILKLDCDFVGFLHSGIHLSEFALNEFIKDLNQSSNSELLYSDNDYLDKNNVRVNPFFKPDWSPYLFRSIDYLSPFYIIKKTILKKIDSDLIISKCFNFDILLQSIENTNFFRHISIPLCSIKNKTSVNFDSKQLALSNHLKRINIDAKVKPGLTKNTFQIKYSNNKKPKVSIIIPTKNNYNILKRCIDSIEKKTNYKNKEIIIVDNSSTDNATKKYYSSLSHKIITYSENFNFSKMNNLAVQSSSGQLLLFLNDDTKVLDSFWLDELVSITMQKDVGVVGPKLIFSDNTIQHAGVVFLKTGSGFHPLMKQLENSNGYHNVLNSMRDYSAVTGACLMIKKEIFDKVGTFDNSFDVYYGDADLCLQVVNMGYRVIYTPFTKLLHEGSFTITKNNASHFDIENHLKFIKKWPYLKNGDPFYNSNLDWDYAISKTPFKTT